MSRQIKITVSDEFYAELADYARASGEVRVTELLRFSVSQYMRRYPRHMPKCRETREDCRD